MTIRFFCRHCGTKLGDVPDDRLNVAQLGTGFLTEEERKDIIAINPGKGTEVYIVCEYCQEALEACPELSLLPNPLQ